MFHLWWKENLLKYQKDSKYDYRIYEYMKMTIDYLDFKENYKVIPIDLSKQKALDTAPKLVQETNFTGNLDWNENGTMFFIIEEAKETILDFLQGTARVS